MDLQERHQLEAARQQVAKVKARTRPWRYVFALVLAVIAAAVSVQARYVADLPDHLRSGSVLDALGKQGNLALSYGTAVAFGLLAGAGPSASATRPERSSGGRSDPRTPPWSGSRSS